MRRRERDKDSYGKGEKGGLQNRALLPGERPECSKVKVEGVLKKEEKKFPSIEEKE